MTAMDQVYSAWRNGEPYTVGELTTDGQTMWTHGIAILTRADDGYVVETASINGDRASNFLYRHHGRDIPIPYVDRHSYGLGPDFRTREALIAHAMLRHPGCIKHTINPKTRALMTILEA